jgi:hypothetical protein
MLALIESYAVWDLLSTTFAGFLIFLLWTIAFAITTGIVIGLIEIYLNGRSYLAERLAEHKDKLDQYQLRALNRAEKIAREEARLQQMGEQANESQELIRKAAGLHPLGR